MVRLGLGFMVRLSPEYIYRLHVYTYIHDLPHVPPSWADCVCLVHRSTLNVV